MPLQAVLGELLLDLGDERHPLLGHLVALVGRMESPRAVEGLREVALVVEVLRRHEEPLDLVVPLPTLHEDLLALPLRLLAGEVVERELVDAAIVES